VPFLRARHLSDKKSSGSPHQAIYGEDVEIPQDDRERSVPDEPEGMPRIAILILVAIALCLISFLAGAYYASNSLPFRNCFTPNTPCMRDRT